MIRAALILALVSLNGSVAAIAAAPQRSAVRPAAPLPAAAKPGEYAVTGLVLAVDPPGRTLTVSHGAIDGVMDAMAMAFEVKDRRELDGVEPGAVVRFTLVVTRDSSYARGVHVTRYESVEQDPLAARRLALLKRMLSGNSPVRVAIGDAAPAFTLLDQRRVPVSLTSLAGRSSRSISSTHDVLCRSSASACRRHSACCSDGSETVSAATSCC